MPSLTSDQTHQLIEQSAPFYLPEGYHVGEHRHDVEKTALQIAAAAMSWGIKLDSEVLVLAANWHDAATAINPAEFHINERGLWRPAKHSEEVAKQLFTYAAEKVGAPSRLIRAVGCCVMGTNPTEPLTTKESKVVAAADIHGVGFNPFEAFVADTNKLWHEAEWRQARTIPWQEFVRGSIGYLGLFMARNIRLTENYFDEAERSAWHVGAVGNVLELANRTWDKISVNGYWAEDTSKKSKQPKSIFNLQIKHPCESEDKDHDEIRISLPVNDRILSLPDGVLDELHVSDNIARSPGVSKCFGKVLCSAGVLSVENNSI